MLPTLEEPKPRRMRWSRRPPPPIVVRSNRQTEASKERIKASASYFNLLSAGFMTVGIIGLWVRSVGSANDIFQTADAAYTLIVFAVLAVIFRVISHIFLGALQNEEAIE